MHPHTKFFTPSTKQQGFSMIEIMVTIAIIATSLLGTAGLQAYAMRVNQGAQLRTQAVFLASDIVERIEANKIGATSGTGYTLDETGSAPAIVNTCFSATCSASNLASYDLNQWSNSISTLLPQATDWEICTDNDYDSACDSAASVANPTNYLIRIDWTDRRYDKNNTDVTFSYTSSRTISN
jgi:type IV pilus modification protein PilV